jgi:4-amino-4-deoxy-L-arabinose transferase-like glycosyltransferase
MGSAEFWRNSYGMFYDLALNVDWLGIGKTAVRMPLYPVFLALAASFGKSYLWIVIPQAIIGTGTALCAFLISRFLFGSECGFLSASLTAVYPYYVVHDTALQETSLFTFLTALSIFLLCRATKIASTASWILAGISLGMAILTRQTLAPFALLSMAWATLIAGPWRTRLARCAALSLTLSLIVGGWLVRNYCVVGVPILTSELGLQLWKANNPLTFSHYPGESIDLSEKEALAALLPSDLAQIEALEGNEVLESNWFFAKGATYIRGHVLKTLEAAGRKIVAGFSWSFNPSRDWLTQVAYAASYGQISILGIAGMIMARRRWRQLSIIYLLFFAFMAVTAVFWSHTSHRSYLDVYLIVFSAYAVSVKHYDRKRLANLASPMPQA